MNFVSSIISVVFLLIGTATIAQVDDVKKWQEELNAEYKDKFKSPLSTEDREKFIGHTFYSITKNTM